MRFVSIISLLAIATGATAKYCAYCHTDGKSPLVLEDECKLSDGGVKCYYSVHEGNTIKSYIYCKYDHKGQPLKHQPEGCFAKADSLKDTCSLPSCTK